MSVSCWQGFSAASPQVGTTVLPGLPGAHSHRPACPEGGLCDAGVHTVWVGIYLKKQNKHTYTHTKVDTLLFTSDML